MILLTITSCAVKKYVPEGEFLYRGGKINLHTSEKINNKAELKDELEDVLYPEPNSKFLGMYPGLHYYYVYKEEKDNFWRKFMYNRMGESPAYFSDVNVDNTEELLQNRLENNGFFYGKIDNEVKIDSSKKTAKIDYDIKIGKPYIVEKFEFEPDSTDPKALNDKIKEALTKTEIKEGEDFNLSDFKKERERIDDYLKDRGYYYFNKDFLLFEADTNQYADRKLNLYLKLKSETPEKSKYPHIIDSLLVYSGVYNDTVYGVQDTVKIKNVDFIQSKNNPFFKPKRLRPFILLEKGQYYSSESSRYTSRRLSNIGTYKFVNIHYADSDSIVDSSGNRHLTSVISLSPLPRRRIQFKLEGVKI